MDALRATFTGEGEKSVTIMRGIYPSDQKAFAKGVGICSLKYHKFWGYYMNRIHTAKDTVLDEGNIVLLRDGALRYIASLPQ